MSKPSLLSLPVELKLVVINLLPFTTLQNFAAVHPHLRTIIDLEAIRGATHSGDLLYQLCTAKQSSQFNQNHQVCCECLRLRPNAKFTSSLGRERRNAINLFCDDCGTKGSEAPEPWCKKCKIVSLVSDRHCVRNSDLEQSEGFRVPVVGDMLPSNGVLPALDVCPMSRRERWCLRDEWAMAWACS